ncbi:MAG: leucine/isoleucine/valine transporter permease subunit [Chloroflexota bacterium]
MLKPTTNWKQTVQLGLITGAVTLLISLVGMIETFGKRDIISGIISMGHILLLAPFLFSGFIAARKVETKKPTPLLATGAVIGLLGGAVLALLLALGHVINVRALFINASPMLYRMIAFGLDTPLGIISPILGGMIMSSLGAALLLLRERIRKTIINTLVWVIMIGLLRDLITTVISRWGPVAYAIKWIFAPRGLAPIGAIALIVLIGGLTYWREGRAALPKPTASPERKKQTQALTLVGTALILLLTPLILGIFFSEILDNVGLYILMGLGLNIVVGFAGLLDLGYVAFFAIGAYTIGVLTSPERGFFNLTFWEALPFAVGMAVLAGVILGLPVLKMRGDYLAIVTLGFGEIIRLLALSDWLRPYLGGSTGIQLIARPKIGPWELTTQTHLYYLILLGMGIAAFITWRLKDSRLGRAWMALREDEDVAQAMGINLVATKLLAFATGAFFGGLSGAIFASKLTATYPHSFNLLVSINALCLIIVGGMGSIPGVFVGALALMGSPDLLREFAEFRYLVYGALLVGMMLMRPEGLWPEARRRLELHEAEELSSVVSPAD